MTAVTTASPATRTGPAPTWGGGRIALIVVGAILGLLGISILVGGVAVAVVDNTRDRDGYLGLWSALGIRVDDATPYAVLAVDRAWQRLPA